VQVRRFFTDTRYFWLGCTRFPPCNYPVSRSLRLLYCLQLGFYLQAWAPAGKVWWISPPASAAHVSPLCHTSAWSEPCRVEQIVPPLYAARSKNIARVRAKLCCMWHVCQGRSLVFRCSWTRAKSRAADGGLHGMV